MPVDKIRVKIYPLSENLFQGGGFYQIEEGTLLIISSPIKSGNQFFSYLECENLRIDTSQNGNILFIELQLPKKKWFVDENLKFPSPPQKADIRILDFRQSISSPKLLTNQDHTILKIEWFKEPNVSNYLIANDIILEVNSHSQLNSIWINNITDDKAGQSIAKLKAKYLNH